MADDWGPQSVSIANVRRKHYRWKAKLICVLLAILISQGTKMLS